MRVFSYRFDLVHKGSKSHFKWPGVKINVTKHTGLTKKEMRNAGAQPDEEFWASNHPRNIGMDNISIQNFKKNLRLKLRNHDGHIDLVKHLKFDLADDARVSRFQQIE